MKKRDVFFIALLVMLASSAKAEETVAQFRGYTAVEEVLSSRLQPSGFSFSRYGLPAPLLDLMGTWSNPASQREYHNGVPNAVNALLWYLNLDAFANEMSEQCKTTTLVSKPIAKAMRQLCTWPSAAAKTDAVMSAIWLSIIGYDAPPSEYEAWRDFFRNSSYATKGSRETVRAMTLAIAMNPYFLLRN